ncbi:MAG: twin-arginine translocase TatA/TatE family subunit [Bacteroidales bacterium]|nr:twin-arginine translocase TatA/TatE family subunit [Bacteroidales bacterium]
MNSILLFGGLGPTEIIILLVLVLLLFGGRKIPELMRGVGKGISEFKQGVKDPTEDSEKEDKKK